MTLVPDPSKVRAEERRPAGHHSSALTIEPHLSLLRSSGGSVGLPEPTGSNFAASVTAAAAAVAAANAVTRGAPLRPVPVPPGAEELQAKECRRGSEENVGMMSAPEDHESDVEPVDSKAESLSEEVRDFALSDEELVEAAPPYEDLDDEPMDLDEPVEETFNGDRAGGTPEPPSPESRAEAAESLSPQAGSPRAQDIDDFLDQAECRAPHERARAKHRAVASKQSLPEPPQGFQKAPEVGPDGAAGEPRGPLTPTELDSSSVLVGANAEVRRRQVGSTSSVSPRDSATWKSRPPRMGPTQSMGLGTGDLAPLPERLQRFWGDRQAAQHRHVRSWVVARAMDDVHGRAADPHAVSREAAQLRALVRDIDTQILAFAAVDEADEHKTSFRRNSVITPRVASPAALPPASDRLDLLGCYLRILKQNVQEDVLQRTADVATEEDEALQADLQEAAAGAIERLEHAITQRLNKESARGSNARISSPMLEAMPKANSARPRAKTAAARGASGALSASRQRAATARR